jgi:pectin methylesterase-like acyl-CoA thioesterase
MKQSINMNITLKTILICFLFLISSMGVFGATLSDQGTDVRYKSTGYLVDSGDITISIWDSISGGTNIFNYTYSNAIINGSWNVMIGEAPSPDLSLNFNTLYYKDYSIDGEDIDFINGLGATVERQVFESPLGTINYNNLTNVPSYITDGDDDILGALACSSDQIARYNGTAWECDDTETLGQLSCSSNQITRYNGTVWECVFAGELNSTMNPNDVVFANWDKNASDDFNGSWYSLSDVPSGFADGIDNNTDDTGWKNYISTGLIDGGTLSINADTTKFDIANTSCYFLNLTDLNNPGQTQVDFSINTGIISQYRTTNAGTFIGYYQNGTVMQQVLDFSRNQLNEICRLGRISHFDRTQIDKVYNFPLTVETDLDFASWVIQHGVVRVDGCEIEVGSNALGVKRLDCETLRIGAGGNRDRINFPMVPEEDNFDLLWSHSNGVGTTIIEGSYNYIDVNNYELSNGTLQEITENKYSNIWIYFFPNNISDTTFMIRDNREYDDLFSAIEGIEESPIINNDIKGGMFLAGISFRKGISDLSTAIEDNIARINHADSFGEVIRHQSGLVSLRNTLNTGLLSGGLLTINSNPTLINISSGEAIIVDYSDVGNVKKDRLSWTDLTYAPNLAGVRSKWIGVQKHATTGESEFVSAVAFTALEKRTIAVIGRVWGNGTTTITGKGQYSTPAFGYDKTVEDFISVFGSMNIQGNVFTATNGDLRIDKSSGKSFRFGAAFATEPLSPNIHVDPEIVNLSSYKYHLQNSTTTISESQIDSSYYDLNGVKTIMPVGKYHIQRIYYFPVSGTVHITYGQATYNSMGEALLGINTETVNLNDDILDGSILRSYLVMRESETDLSATTYVRFITANNIGGGGSGAGISDHGSMSGLLDDDHPQYILADGSRNVTENFTVEKDIIAQNIHANISFNYLQDVPAGLSDGDNDSLANLNCSDLQVIQYNNTLGGFQCIDALSFTDTTLNDTDILALGYNHTSDLQDYFDSRYATNGKLNLYFYNTSDTSFPSYTVMNQTVPLTTMTTTHALTTGQNLLTSRIVSNLDFSLIESGAYDQHTTIDYTTGTKILQLSSEIYKRLANGTEELIGSSVFSDALTTGIYQDVDWVGTLTTDTTFNSGDYLVMKLYAQVSGGGLDPTVDLVVGGVTGARLSIGIDPVDITNFEQDPIFSAWDRQTGINISTSQIYDYSDSFANYTSIVTVDKNGNSDFNTIQAAIDSIIDANSTNRYTIQIYPGTYEEQITTKDYVSVLGMGSWNRDVKITSNAHPVVDLVGASSNFRNIHVYSAPTVDQTECLVKAVDGSKFILDSLLETRPVNAVSCNIEFTNNSLAFIQRSGIYLISTGTTTGSNNIDAIRFNSGTNNYYVQQNLGLISIEDVDDNLHFVVGYGTGQTDSVIANNDIEMISYATGYTGQVDFFSTTQSSPSGEAKHLTANVIHLKNNGTGGTGTIFNLNNGVSGITLYSDANHYRVIGFTNNRFGDLLSGNTLTSHFDDINAVDSVIGNGTYNYVNAPSDGNLQISGSYLNMYDNALMVAPRGGDYNTIQAAIDSITDASSINPYAILIYPGTYSEQISMKSNVNLVGMGAWARQVRITSNTHPVVNWTTSERSEMKNIMIESLPTTDQSSCMIMASGGQKSMFDMVLSTTSTNANACMLEVNGVLPFISSRVGVYYNQLGETTGAQNQEIFQMKGTNFYILGNWIVNANIYSQDDNFTLLKDFPGSIRQFNMNANSFTINALNTSYTGTMRLFCDEAAMTIPNGENTFQANSVNVKSPSNSGIGVALCLREGNSKIETIGNHIDVNGFGTNYAQAIGPNAIMDSYFDEIQATDGFNNLGGQYNYVNSPSAGNFQISGAFLNQYEQVITVESRGGDFQTIQAAIDSITDASEDKTYTIKVMPGYYSENILLKDWVDLEGIGGWQSIINGTITWNNTANTPDGWSNVMLMAIEYTATSPGETILNIDEGLHDFDRCYFYTEGDSIAWHLVDIDAGTSTFYNTEFEYIQTGDATSSEHNMITVGGTGSVKLLYDEFNVDIEDSNRDVNIVYSGASEGGLDHQASLSEIILHSSSYSGTVTFLNVQGNTNDNRFVGNNINIIGNGSGTAKMYNLDSGSAEIRSASNIINIQDFANNYFAEITTNDKLYSHFDDIQAINGTIGSPADYEYVNSEADGEFTVTEHINIGQGVNQDMTLIEALVGEIINPKLKYIANWFGRAAAVWDDPNNPSVFGVYSENENAGTIIRSGNESLNQYLMLYGGLEGWIFERLGSSNGDLYLSPDGAEANAPLHLEHGPPYRTYLNNGAGVNDIDTVIDGNSNNTQIVTALGIKNYVDSNLGVQYTHLSNFTDDISTIWDKNVSDDFNGSWNALSDIPLGFSDNIDNDTQLNESQVDAFVVNNGFIGDDLIESYNGTLNLYGNFSFENIDMGNLRYTISTGLVLGGTLSINSGNDSLIDVTSGVGIYADYSDINNPIVEEISWSTSNGIDAELAGKVGRWVGVERISEGVGQIVIEDAFSQLQKRTIVVLGRIWGPGNGTITGAAQYSNTVFGDSHSFEDLTWTLGTINKEGNVFSANGANLQLDKTAGVSFRYASGYSSSPTSPNIRLDSATINYTSYKYNIQNQSYINDEPSVDPDYYDLNGVKTLIPTDNWTVQRIYYFPGSKVIHLTYGQAIYDTLQDATSGISNEPVILNADILDGGVLRGFLVLKQGTTNLSDTDENSIITYTGFSTGTGSGGGATVETDPIFTSSVAFDITSTDKNNWDSAFSWNNHALSGYLVSSDLDWGNLTGIPAGFADNVDNNTQLDESQVDAFVANNNYAVENTTVEFTNVTIAAGECYGGAQGGAICFNSTDTWII